MKKLISILGSTGSVGLCTLKIIEKRAKEFKPFVFSADKNYKLISQQIIKYKPVYFIINNEKVFKKIKKKFEKSSVIITNNYDEIKKIRSSLSITVSAIPGIVGLLPMIKLINFSNKILIANKEAIVCGWNLIRNKANNNNTKLIPLDSEHFSIFQLIKNHKLNEIKKIYITSSGGPFLNHKLYQFKKIKPKDALKHPKWKMGNKISIDSATLVNKILELVEAQKLFNIPPKKLDVIIHPNSLIHAIVVFNNGITKMLYHPTTMIIPIVNAIFNDKIDVNDFYKHNTKKKEVIIENLIFKKVDVKKFPIIKLRQKVNEHPSSAIIFNAANEVLVEQFLKKRIPYLAIIKGISDILRDRNYRKYAIKKPKTLNQILAIDNWARKKVLKNILHV